MRAVRAAIAACLFLGGCTSTSPHPPTPPGQTSASPAPAEQTSASPTPARQTSASPTATQTAAAGTAEAPFVTENCRTAEPRPPEPDYITVGALAVPTMPDVVARSGGNTPVPDSDGVTFYKGGIEVRSDYPVVTVTIGAAARSYARIDNERYHGPLPHGALAVTFAGKPRIEAEKTWTCWYVGGYNLLDGRTTACLPLDIAFAGDPVVHHVRVPIGVKC